MVDQPEPQQELTESEQQPLSETEALEESQETDYSLQPLSPEEQRTVAEQIDIKREDTRSNLAEKFVWILVGTYLLSFVTMISVLLVPIFMETDREARNEQYVYTKDIISILITTQTGLVGSIIGFYFGSNQLQNKSDQ